MLLGPANRPNDYVEPPCPRQIEILRRMTGEQRLLRSLDMIRTAWRISADATRNENPGIAEADVKERIRLRRAAIYRHEVEFDLWHRLQRDTPA
jgi:hypothetical protein